MPYTLSDTPATTAISFSPAGVLTLPAMSGGNRLCICRVWLSSLIFQSSFMSFTVVFVRMVSCRCHAVRCGSPPSVSQSAFWVCARGTAIAPSASNTARHRRFISGLLSQLYIGKHWRGVVMMVKYLLAAVLVAQTTGYVPKQSDRPAPVTADEPGIEPIF